MARGALNIGPCYCKTGRERFGREPSVHIRWENAWDQPLPPQSPVSHALDSDPDSDSDSNMVDAPDSQSEEEGEDFNSGSDSDGDEEEDEEGDDEEDGKEDDGSIQDGQDDAAQGNHSSQTSNWVPLLGDGTMPVHIDESPSSPGSPDFQPMLLHSEILSSGIMTAMGYGNDVLGNDLVGIDNVDVDDGLSDINTNSTFDENEGFTLAPGLGFSFSDFENENENENDEEADENNVPKISEYRLNLTALSQRYNMYAIAYGSTIHIYRIRSCVDHSFPTHPDLLLEPPASRMARQIGGYIDRVGHHQMNNLIIGDLGDEEILLFACDDGDILAYYTSKIENRLLYLESGHSPDGMDPVQPFFHQNVGISAWGLAIHKESRLIAVGSNKHEIHVFVFALKGSSSTSLQWITTGVKETFIRLRNPNTNLPGSEHRKTPLPCRQRKLNYCLVFETLAAGNNIPNVAFTSDADGRAAAVLGVDISGNLWAADIWSFGPVELVDGLHHTFQATERRRNPDGRMPIEFARGWGVLVLPESSFLPTKTFKESLGISPIEATYVYHEGYGYYIDINEGIHHVKNNSPVHWLWRENKAPFLNAAPIAHNFDTRCAWYNPGFDFDKDWDCTQDMAADHPSSTPPPVLPKDKGPNNYAKLLAHGSSVMRTYGMDVELVGGGDHTGIMSSGIIYQEKPSRHAPHLFFPPERLANIIHVPELSLVVAGSLCGRVVLITLTRPTNPNYSFHRGFRVDAVLPRSTDEDQHLRPLCPLYGVAIGPIPSAAKGRILGERRYRLMIHYYDHRILSYEVYRNTMTNALFVN